MTTWSIFQNQAYDNYRHLYPSVVPLCFFSVWNYHLTLLVMNNDCRIFDKTMEFVFSCFIDMCNIASPQSPLLISLSALDNCQTSWPELCIGYMYSALDSLSQIFYFCGIYEYQCIWHPFFAPTTDHLLATL